VAPVYDSLRTTDEAPVRRIREMLPNSLLVGLDLGCGTGRYSRLLHALLPDGSLLAASDVSAAMLTELQAVCDSGASVVPLRCTAEELPIRTGALDLVTAFNSVHHFDLGRFLAEAARVLGADGRLFVYTRTPEQTRLDHPDDHPDDRSGSVGVRLDRRAIQREQARSVGSRPGRRRACGSESEGRGFGSDLWARRPCFRASTSENEPASGVSDALAEMEKQAAHLGADAVVGVDIDYETVGDKMLMVSASGTAVKLG
jgi:hypothetical protein